jgi:tetratricopeptide (TPR) repeat protein
MAAVRRAADEQMWEQVWGFGWNLGLFLDRRGHWTELATLVNVTTAAAECIGTATASAVALRLQGLLHMRRQEFDQGLVEFRRALDLHEQAHDVAGWTTTKLWVGLVLVHGGRLEDALPEFEGYYRAALSGGHRLAEADGLNVLGCTKALLGDYLPALELCSQAVALAHELGDRHGEANAWDSLGYIQQQLGHPAEALDCYERCRDLIPGSLIDTYNVTQLWTHFGDLHRELGHLDAARDSYRRSLAILEELGHPDAGQIRGRLQDLENAITSGSAQGDHSRAR